MPKLSLTVPHTLEQPEAENRIKTLISKLKDRHGANVSDLVEEWVGNVLKFGFKTFGFKVGGTMSVDDKGVNVQGDIPLAAMMFKGRIENEIRETLSKFLAP